MLPDGWRKTKLGKCVDIKSGVAPSNLPLKRYGKYPYVKVEDMNNCSKFQKESREYTDYNHNYIRSGAVIFPKRGAAIMNNKVRISINGIYLDSNMMALQPNSETTSEFLYYLITFCGLFKIADTSTIPQINNKHILPYPILLPPLPEQKKIAAILSTWDRAIEGTERLLANSQQQKKALMQQLLTGKKHLPGFTGDWIWKRSKEIFKSISIKNNPMDCELLSVTQDQGVVLRSSLERRVVMPDGSVQGYKLVNPGNFIISLRSFQGGLEYSYFRGLVSPAYTVLENKIEIENEFFKFYFKSYDFIGHLAVATIGIRDGKQISYEDFSFIKLPYPPLPEQKAIAAVLTAADKEITAIESDLSRLRQEQKALMQQLLTGKRLVAVD